MSYADQLAKAHYQDYFVKEHLNSVEELTGLSCRWSPIPSKKSLVLSLLIAARGSDDSSTYQDILNKIRQAIDCSIEEANPAHQDKKNYKSFWSALKDEYRYHRSIVSLNFVKRLVDIIFAVLIFSHQINPIRKLFDEKSFTSSINDHSDFRKFDDTLRLIIDCEEQQSLDLLNELKKLP